MQLAFHAIQELEAGPEWQAIVDRLWPAYRTWYLKEGDARRPNYLEASDAFARAMPELLPTLEELVELGGGSDTFARMMTMFRPPAFLSGCSQAVWLRDPGPVLVRNYDYAPELLDGIVMLTKWGSRRVLAVTDCLWGVLDGVNDDGLAVSLSFAGSQSVGEGFGITIILRYVLETCSTVAEACDAIGRVPSHMAYNITLLDQSGSFATVHVFPGREPNVTKDAVATNHQRDDDWPAHAKITGSRIRYGLLQGALHDPQETLDTLISRFQTPPVFSTKYDKGWGTLYTAAYDSIRRSMTLLLPGALPWHLSCQGFNAETRVATYPVHIAQGHARADVPFGDIVQP